VKIWMILNERGCPRTWSWNTGRTSPEGYPIVYRWERNGYCEVDDADADIILNQVRLFDRNNMPYNPFSKEPPPEDLDTEDRVRVQVESQAQQIAELKALVTKLLGSGAGSGGNGDEELPSDVKAVLDGLAQPASDEPT